MQLESNIRDMATHNRLELRRAFEAQDSGDEHPLCHSAPLKVFPSEDEWKVYDIAYAIGIEVGYAKGFVHATGLLFTAMLAAAVLASL
jgi:hypothetical protein